MPWRMKSTPTRRVWLVFFLVIGVWSLLLSVRRHQSQRLASPMPLNLAKPILNLPELDFHSAFNDKFLRNVGFDPNRPAPTRFTFDMMLLGFSGTPVYKVTFSSNYQATLVGQHPEQNHRDWPYWGGFISSKTWEKIVQLFQSLPTKPPSFPHYLDDAGTAFGAGITQQNDTKWIDWRDEYFQPCNSSNALERFPNDTQNFVLYGFQCLKGQELADWEKFLMFETEMQKIINQEIPWIYPIHPTEGLREFWTWYF